jgi:hypothetical protein
VSRFLFFSIQMNLSENIFLHQVELGRPAH